MLLLSVRCVNDLVIVNCIALQQQSNTGTLALPGTERCFLKEFRTWHFSRYGINETYSPFITSEEFFDRLKLFRCNAPALPSNSTCDDATASTDWSELIGIVNDELKFIGIECVSSLQWDTPYVFFDWISHSHLFNKLQIQPTYMNKYSSSLSLVFHSLIHTLIQVISHTYVTLEPQIFNEKRRHEER